MTFDLAEKVHMYNVKMHCSSLNFEKRILVVVEIKSLKLFSLKLEMTPY